MGKNQWGRMEMGTDGDGDNMMSPCTSLETSKSSVSQWTASNVVHSYDLYRRITSSYHGSRHQLDSGVSLSLGRQCGTVCHQPCVTTVCH